MSSTFAPSMSSAERMDQTLRSVLPTRAYHPLAKMLDAGFCLAKLGFREFRRLRALTQIGPQTARKVEKLTIPSLLHPNLRPAGFADSIMEEGHGFVVPIRDVEALKERLL